MNKPIAIVGMSCRFPGGVSSPEDFWQLLLDEKDAITEIPPSRFGTEFYQHPLKREPGKSYTFSAGVLDDVAGFDASFFGISPREAQQMDPQQRLLLELAWETFEDAGQRPADLAGSNCAVFIGIASQDYGDRGVDDLSIVDAYSATGNTNSIASNRISYIFDLRGPSMSIDTACSSSLVALHQACQSILNGDAEMGLAGGVNLLLHPFPFVSFSKASMLSPTGRCRAFDASGDGYVRSEGGALVLLKPLDKALADGDTIHALITSSGVNSDGHSQGGINVPASATQAALLRSVYARAGVDASELTYVEAHGTGTAVGDPIEARALIDVIGKSRAADQPLLIGSAKTNVGHLETASGMAGLIKTILCLKHRAIPTTVHFKTPNPRIDFAGGGLRVIDRYTKLGDSSKPLLMGVNSFGFGGTNAHVLLQEAHRQAEPPSPEQDDGKLPSLVLSARAPDALHALAARYRQQIAGGLRWSELASSTAHKRQWLSHRAVICPASEEEGMLALEALAKGESTGLVVHGEAPGADDRLALVFSGNGSQWAGMGRMLLDEDASFRDAVLEVDSYWAKDGSPSLTDVMRGGATTDWLEATENSQPLLFAIQVGIVHVMLARGLRYHACFGHSVGEVAAAWAAGALTLEQAVHVIKVRSRAQGKTRGQGRMAAVGLSHDAIRQQLVKLGLSEAIEIAGINSPNAVTIAGPLTALEKLAQPLQQQGHFFQMLELDYAFHSTNMDQIHGLVTEGLTGLRPQETHYTYVSTVTGQAMLGTALDANYWWQNIREPVRFHDATRHLIDSGIRLFVEVGPHSILRSYVSKSLEEAKVRGHVLPTLKRNHDGAAILQHALLAAVANGAALDVDKVYPKGCRQVLLPTYPWQRQRHWLNPTAEGYDLVNRRRQHPLLGYRLKNGIAWENQLDPVKLPTLGDHVVDGAVTFPGAGYAEMALAAAQLHFGSERCAVENLEIQAPAVFQPQQGKQFRFTVDPEDGRFVIESRNRLAEEPWTLNAAGRLLVGGPALRPSAVDPEADFAEAERIDGTVLYAEAATLGLMFGDTFRGIRSLRVVGDCALAEIAVPEALEEALPAYVMHPALIDSGFHPLLGLLADPEGISDTAAYVPVQMGRIDHFCAGVPQRVLARIDKRSPHSVVATFTYLGSNGESIAKFSACRFRKVDLAGRRRSQPDRFTFIAETKPYGAQSNALALPAPDALLATAAAAVACGEEAARRQQHLTEVLPLLDVLAAAYALRAVESLGVLEGHPQAAANPWLLERLIDMLVEDGVLLRQEGRLLRGEETLPMLEDLWRELLASSPGHVAELTLLSHCGAALPALLKGEIQAEDVLPSERSSLVEHLYEASPTWAHVNLMTTACLTVLTDNWHGHHRLRVLEINAPDANLSLPIGARLPAARCEYVIAGSAEQLDTFDLTSQPLVRTVRLELGQEPKLASDAGLPVQFDVVILNNLLRGDSHPRALLQALRAWLAPGALLLVAENQPSRFADIVFGLHPSWWEQGGRFLPAETLLALLQETGYEAVTRHIEADLAVEGAPALLLARQPAITAQPGPNPTPVHWTLVCPGDEIAPLAKVLADKLQTEDQQVRCCTVAQLSEEWLADSINTAQHLVFLAAASNVSAGDGHAMLDVQERTTLALANLVRQLATSGATPLPQLWIVTCGGATFVADQDDAAAFRPDQAPLWGLGRVIMNEYPELACRLVDLHPACLQRPALLAHELLSAEREEEVLLTPTGRFVPRMVPTQVGEQRNPQAMERHEASTPSVLSFESPGSLRNLRWFPLPERELEADEVEIEPAAVGLNFRDVMYAMGLLSDEAVENGFAGPTIGMELSGRIRRVGHAVTAYAPGDAVLGFAPAAYASRVRTRVAAIAPKPAHLSFEEAATIPATFFTAFYALCELARLRAGERVLIHGAAGGVGIAAIQLARRLGAEVFATAGSNEKREFVRLLGADHVLDSRSLAFADRIMQLTNGVGVDVVLNSLAGEAMIRSIDVLRPFGRFLELGKRDFYENSRIGLRPFRNNISYFGIDADQLMQALPGLTGRLFAEVMQLLENGELHPLPYRAFPAERVEDAFRYMQQARQIGKILVTFAHGAPAPDTPAAQESLRLDPNAAYLVAGGTSGLGFATARWMVSRGARHLVLISRSGKLAAELVSEAESWQRTLGVTVQIEACDLTDAAAVQVLFAAIAASGTQLKGVVHSAMVIADGLIANLDDARFRTALAPKIAGAWNLHMASQGLALDFFVVYSSATTFLGNPGQANYVAGNAFLESLVALRRASGLPACFMAWGPLEDVGFLARNTETKEAIQARIGGSSINSTQAMAALERVLLENRSGEALLWLDWDAIQRVMPAARACRYHELQRRGGHDHHRASAQGLRSHILTLAPVEAARLIEETLQGEMARILHLSRDKIELNRSVLEMGMDSLMGMELGLAVEESFGVKLPLMVLAEGATVHSLAQKIVDSITAGSEPDSLQNGMQEQIAAMARQHVVEVSAEDIQQMADKVSQKTSAAEAGQ